VGGKDLKGAAGALGAVVFIEFVVELLMPGADLALMPSVRPPAKRMG